MEPKTFELMTEDDHSLCCTLYPAAGVPKAHLVVAGATGVPQGFYRRFASYAAEQGYQVWTLDYRGIGRSAPPSLRGFRMDYLDWARKDLAALVDVAYREAGDAVFLVGHSFGGHALGLLPNVEKVAACYTFATGAGWHGWMPLQERWKVWLMWNVLGPLLTLWKGYLPWKMLGMGEDLPLDVYRQWRSWCRFPQYFFDAEIGPQVALEFERVRIPIVAANALDDHWATPRSRDAFMKGYRNAPWQGSDIIPAQFGLKAVGHMGYFRPQAQPIWEQTLRWFGSQVRPA